MPVARAATAAPAPPHAAATAHDADVRDAADTAAAPDLPMRAPASQPMAASAQPPPTRDSDSAPLQLADLAPQERKALPPLRLSMHLWNDDPSRRFVILDGNRLGEGDRLGNLVVTAIVHDGVLLDWNGRALKVPLR